MLSNKALFNLFKYGDKTLVVKSLVNILKYAYWAIKVHENGIEVSKIV